MSFMTPPDSDSDGDHNTNQEPEMIKSTLDIE